MHSLANVHSDHPASHPLHSLAPPLTGYTSCTSPVRWTCDRWHLNVKLSLSLSGRGHDCHHDNINPRAITTLLDSAVHEQVVHTH